MNDFKNKEMTLRDLLRVIFRHKLIIISCFLTIMCAVYLGLELRTPVYRSQVRILVTGKMQKDLDVERDLGPGKLVLTQMSLVMSKPILERTVKALKLDKRPLDYELAYASRFKKLLVERRVRALERELESLTPEERQSALLNMAMNDLSGKISTFLEGDTSIFYIVVDDFNPQAAGRIANVLSRSYIIFDLEQQIAELQLTYGNKNDSIVKLEKYIETIEETLDGRILPDIEAIGPATVKIITQAGLGVLKPQSPSLFSGLLAAFIMSLVIGTVFAFLFDFFDQTFKSPDDVRKYLNLPSLGSLPKRKGKDRLLMRNDNPVSRYYQLLQNLSNKIYLSMKDQNIKTVLLADTEGSDETAVIAANIGIYLSQSSGNRVLLIDANLRNPLLHKIFNINMSPGLTDVIEGKDDYENAVHDSGSNLSILPAGNSLTNPSYLLESPKVSDVMKKAKELYDIIFINCSDISNFSDAVILTSCIDSTALIINADTVRYRTAKHAIDPLQMRKINMLGAVLTNQKYVIPEILYRLT